ncbi:hypothetical protein F511_35803 [Dorcoceras hygrometricum]|uniref:Uncharacterized protein n=1 Tax=Dorcoceras hygrometricum TaxID=472368 RepID=A0A2Z7CDL4_9LAMI|nr:hypothetical protein F511_35803 [Dorcoceras hygrometricum]
MQSTVAFDWIHCSSRLDKSCDWMQSNSWFIETLDWMCCCLRLDVQLVLNICFQLIVQSLVSNACDWISQRLVDQMMSYQLIQTTSFAMHPRLVKYNAEALVWMYCSCLLVSCDCCSLRLDIFSTTSLLLASGCTSYLLILATALLKPSAEYDDVTDDIINANSSADSPARRRFISFASLHLLILIANAKRCRSNLFTRHRFAIANSNKPTAGRSSLLILFHCSFLLIDDVTADVIYTLALQLISSSLQLQLAILLLLE